VQTKTITGQEALAIATREEGHFYDRKATAVSGAKLQKAAVAFANADGGELYVGVTDTKHEPDPTKRWRGPDLIEAFNQHIQALTEIEPALPFTLTFLKADGHPGYVLRVEIEKSSDVHKAADGTVYERKGAQSLPVSDPQRIASLGFAKGAQSFEDYPVEAALAEDVVDSIAVSKFLADYSPKTDPLELAINKSLVDRKTFKPRVAGILLFADDPPSKMPRKCAVKIARYQPPEDEPDRDHLKNVQSIEAPIYDLIHRTVEKITATMSSIKIWTTEGLNVVDYPPETVWEVVVNAIIHRDYSISDDVQIHIFDDRIVVSSPGRLPGYVTVENILDARFARNPRIVGMLTRYADPPNKDIGEGLNTAFQKMKEWKLRAPEVQVEGNYVRVTIPHTPLATPAEAILAFLENSETITNRQARDITGIRSENAMKSEFYKLKEAGHIEMVPDLKGSKAAWQKTK
jgi:ATP-dependent DNA helicase RecG